VPSYCLRLPDVIGPYDNTDRFWTTLEWVKKSHENPIPLSAEDEQKPLSLVYSIDVCRFIIQLVSEPNPASDFINLGHIETPTLEEFIRIIVKFTLIKAKIFALEPRFKAVK
jgi:nucleoside-diphosphate-sugar epimerase